MPTIVKAMSNKRVAKVCCGTTHTMALTANSQVTSWGEICNVCIIHLIY